MLSFYQKKLNFGKKKYIIGNDVPNSNKKSLLYDDEGKYIGRVEKGYKTVEQKRFNPNTVYIKVNNLVAANYIRPHEEINLYFGSGVSGKVRSTLSNGFLDFNYPIYTSLTIHDSYHYSCFKRFCKYLHQVLDYCIKNNTNDIRNSEIYNTSLKCFTILVNCLRIDDHSILTFENFNEAIINFLFDYNSQRKIISHPINYVLSCSSIDGIINGTRGISFIPPNQEFVHYTY
ncbi:MAG: hypothetical protein ACYCST_21155 [Acidimicrobiales bacterium]